MSKTVELLDIPAIFGLHQKSQLPSNILFQKQSIFKDSSTNFDSDSNSFWPWKGSTRLWLVLYGKSYFSGRDILYKLLGDGLEVITEWCECLRNGIHLGFLLFPLLSNVQPTLITLHQTWLNTVKYFHLFINFQSFL